MSDARDKSFEQIPLEDWPAAAIPNTTASQAENEQDDRPSIMAKIRRAASQSFKLVCLLPEIFKLLGIGLLLVLSWPFRRLRDSQASRVGKDLLKGLWNGFLAGGRICWTWLWNGVCTITKSFDKCTTVAFLVFTIVFGLPGWLGLKAAWSGLKNSTWANHKAYLDYCYAHVVSSLSSQSSARLTTETGQLDWKTL